MRRCLLATAACLCGIIAPAISAQTTEMPEFAQEGFIAGRLSVILGGVIVCNSAEQLIEIFETNARHGLVEGAEIFRRYYSESECGIARAYFFIPIATVASVDNVDLAGDGTRRTVYVIEMESAGYHGYVMTTLPVIEEGTAM